MSEKIDTKYKFREDVYLEEIRAYIDKTYVSHYSTGEGHIQYFELVMQKGLEQAVAFGVNNVGKYAARQGLKKGNERSDIVKMVHYAMMALHAYDLMTTIETDFGDKSGNTEVTEFPSLIELNNDLKITTQNPLDMVVYTDDHPKPLYTIDLDGNVSVNIEDLKKVVSYKTYPNTKEIQNDVDGCFDRECKRKNYTI